MADIRESDDDEVFLREDIFNGHSDIDDKCPSYTQIKPESQERSSTRSFVILILIFLTSVVALAFIAINFPKLEENEKQHIKLPRNIDDAKNLGKVLSRYKDSYYYQVLGAYFITYCSGIGASFCYLLSYLVGRRLVQKYIPDRVEEWRSHVERHREHLLNYIVFLRITPFLPNWFINITSPVINVPMGPFFLGTFLGVAPPSFVAIQAGTTLHQLTSSGDAVSWTSMFILGLFAILSLLPVLLKKQLKEKFD